MPIYHETGDLFTTKAHYIVVPVNNAAIMGRGVALEARKRYIGLQAVYTLGCHMGTQARNSATFYNDLRWTHGIICLTTKNNWRDMGSLELLDSGLITMVAWLKQHPHTAIALPRVGAGLAGLAWTDVLNLINYRLRDSTNTITIYHQNETGGTP